MTRDTAGHVCSFGDKSFENEAIGDVEALAATESMDVARGSVDTRGVVVLFEMWELAVRRT